MVALRSSYALGVVYVIIGGVVIISQEHVRGSAFLRKGAIRKLGREFSEVAAYSPVIIGPPGHSKTLPRSNLGLYLGLYR